MNGLVGGHLLMGSLGPGRGIILQRMSNSHHPTRRNRTVLSCRVWKAKQSIRCALLLHTWCVCVSVSWSRPGSLQKRLNRSRCHSDCGLGWTERATDAWWGVRIQQETGTIWRVTLGRVQTCYGRLFQLYSLGAAAVRSLATRQTTGYL